MKNIKYKTSKILRVLCICILGLSFAACEDFLDRPPFDKFDNEEFWQSEAQARAFMYAVYPTIFPGYGTGTTEPSTFFGETSNDDYMSAVAQTELGPLTIPTSDGSWNFDNVRKANYIIENVDRLNTDEISINHWRGIGRFFRAVFYSNLVFTYGDVPYMDHVPVAGGSQEDMDYLYKDRDPRTFVVGKIMEDFQYAMNNCRANDGNLQINKYVVAAMASRLMLREGTFLKYHGIDAETAAKCLEMAKKASELVMSGSYKLSDNYNGLFSSDDLAGNTEVIMYRKYLDGILAHSMWTITSTSPIQGASKSLAESFLKKDGFPIYYNNEYWVAPTANDFFADRDPRLNLSFRPQYFVRGENSGYFAYSVSGYSCQKYVDDSKITSTTSTLFNRGMNITDAPCLRLGEVLLNYAEICYELESITGDDVFNQGVLDATINKLRDRMGVEMPHLQIVGDEPAIDGVVYDDPKRVQIDPSVPSLLWEIRRERRVELNMEGFRRNDLKRWKKLDYMMNAVNPDIRYGAYIRLSDYPNKDASVVLETPDATEGYILGNTSTQRVVMPTGKNYINPVPTNQITLYKNHGYTLSQTKEWR
jgi:hypothetical protein